jgi:hypothetical protein
MGTAHVYKRVIGNDLLMPLKARLITWALIQGDSV